MSVTTDLTIGRAACRARGDMTQQEVAEEMTRHGVPWRQQTVFKVENGTRRLQLSEAFVLARVLGVTVDSLRARAA